MSLLLVEAVAEVMLAELAEVVAVVVSWRLLAFTRGGVRWWWRQQLWQHAVEYSVACQHRFERGSVGLS